MSKIDKQKIKREKFKARFSELKQTDGGLIGDFKI